ncbi:MAG TPA: LytTR family DNA-binding domain-containing protein [Chitinophagales bacterium]|nr:LytTR family DNA-binding domain-containing protein [Chitinophagales bacterium]
MIRAIVVDDEEASRTRIVSLLSDHADELQLVAVCKSVSEGVAAIRAHHPDLVFLDVEMPPSTGFDLLKQVSNIQFQVIFTTAYDRYAVEAIKFSALDYLLKPISKDDLAAALQRFKNKNRAADLQHLDALFHNLKNIGAQEKKIALPTSGGLVFIYVHDIIRCESEANYTMFHLKSGEKILVSRTLKEFDEMFRDYNFFRVHQSHLINLQHISKYHKGDGGVVVMDDGSHVDVSRRSKEEFLKRLSEK